MYQFNKVEEALEDLKRGRIIRRGKMKEILSVPRSLPPRKILILWQRMERV